MILPSLARPRTPRPCGSRPSFVPVFAVLALSALAGCNSLLGDKLPKEPPPLVDMEEPVIWKEEPDDESHRQDLPAGTFSGVYVDEARLSLDALEGEPEGVVVTNIVENSPGAAAGLREGDIIFEVANAGGAGETVEVLWPSDWRRVELESSPGRRLLLIYDRAGEERQTELELQPRLAPASRDAIETFREEERVGVVVRTATEVEARSAGLGPGAGAVIVGLSGGSPFRVAGLRFGDILTGIDDRPVSHPQILLDAIRETDEGERIAIDYVRDGNPLHTTSRISQRVSELNRFSIPVLLSYEEEGDLTDFSFLLGLFGVETTRAAWELTFLWFIKVAGGDADRLEVEGEAPQSVVPEATEIEGVQP